MENILALRLNAIKFNIEKQQALASLKFERLAHNRDMANYYKKSSELKRAGYQVVPGMNRGYNGYVNPKDPNDKEAADINNLIIKITSYNQRIRQMKSNLQKIQSNVNQCAYDMTQAKARNAQELINLKYNASRKLRKAGNATIDFVSDFCKDGYDCVKRNINNYKADKQNDLKDLDKLTDYILTGGKTVAHSRAVAQKGAHFIEKTELNSGLNITAPANYHGHQVDASVAYYDHYDKFSNSVDIDLNPPVWDTNGPQQGQAIFAIQCYAVTVVLDENGKIDFHNPANKAVLDKEQAMTQILKKYPESFGTIPRDKLKDDKIYNAWSQATKDGAELKAKNEQFPGVDKNGNALDQASYIAMITKMRDDKKLEVEDAKAAWQQFGQGW